MYRSRQVILGVGVSLDGYVSRPDGRVDFLLLDPEYDWVPFFEKVDVWLMGRKTLENAIKMQGGQKFHSQGMRAIVFSKTLPEGKHDGYEVTRKDPAAVVAELRGQPGKHIWLGGGGELTRSFLEADLVDRIELGIEPTLLGAGVPLFPAGFPERRFLLLESKGYPATGLLSVTYERARILQEGEQEE